MDGVVIHFERPATCGAICSHLSHRTHLVMRGHCHPFLTRAPPSMTTDYASPWQGSMPSVVKI